MRTHRSRVLVRLGALVLTLAALAAAATEGQAARLKDIATFRGVRPNQLVGYGLVVGLAGSGDGSDALFTLQSMSSMLEKMGVTVNPEDIKVKNVAAVMVTCELPPFSRTGSRLDALVNSIGDAKALQGGTLLMTPLKGADGLVYAIAQGPVATGGFTVGGEHRRQGSEELHHGRTRGSGRERRARDPVQSQPGRFADAGAEQAGLHHRHAGRPVHQRGGGQRGAHPDSAASRWPCRRPSWATSPP